MARIVENLFSGPVDVVGDIHGEMNSFDRLLNVLGYDENGQHADGRRLVFVGDLVDRGPDSPTVVETVIRLVETGAAQCVLGNHELNILLNARKHGNEWFFDAGHSGELPSKPATDSQRRLFREFFESLPMALERDDLRVVHACWHEPSLDRLYSALKEGHRIASLHSMFSTRIENELRDAGIEQRLESERREFGHLIDYGNAKPNEHWPDPIMLTAHGEAAEIKQMGNPLKVLTSGIERKASSPFPANGKFRFADRVKWWDAYYEEKPVIVGHYWRRFREIRDEIEKNLPPDLFDGISPDTYLGPRQNVFCVDFSVGLSAQKRLKNESTADCSLAAIRWPEEIAVFEDGTTMPLVRRWSPELYRSAWNFASKVHNGQTVPGCGYAYINHLGAVTMEVLACLEREREHKDPNLAMQCALLHDSMEDAGVSFESIVEQFGRPVADGVQALTKNPLFETKKQRMADCLKRTQIQPKEIWLVKLADRITNLQPPPDHWSSEMVEEYREESGQILDQLGQASPYLAGRLRAAIQAYGR